ncbi:MAG: hypothetical protein K2L03_07450, partial [Bacteroidales bacterium]|nr:hypothetical protein [Bacteroidales bacterium]
MKNKNLLTLWAKCAVPALALAAMVLPACEKPVEQHDEEILYYYDNNNPKWNMETLNKYAADKTVRNIYIAVAPGEVFTSLASDNISFRRRELQNAMNVSPKCHGRGNFEFTPGCCTYGDSLDFVAMGFT